MPATHVLANGVIEWIKTEYPSLWVGLLTALPNKSGGGTEAVGGSYGRVEIDSDVIFDTAANSETDNLSQVAFATFSGSPGGSIVAVGLWDTSSSGNLLAWYELPSPRTIGSGDNVAFPIGNLVIRNG